MIDIFDKKITRKNAIQDKQRLYWLFELAPKNTQNRV